MLQAESPELILHDHLFPSGSHWRPECNVVNGRYKYMLDFRALCGESTPCHSLPLARTSLAWQEWLVALATHPDRDFATFIVNGIRHGFKIGCILAQTTALPPTLPKNRVAAAMIEEAISSHIATEAAAGRLLPASSVQSVSISHFSPVSAIPKKGKPSKWRVITDLSFPPGVSVNDGIPQVLTSLTYASIWDAARIMSRLGRGALLSKLDLKDAYRMIPIHPSDFHFMGIHWNGTKWVDAALPFGLQSAPKVFNAVADALLWIMQERGVGEAIHYLDDFLFITPPPNPGVADRTLQLALQCCDHLGVLVAPEKVCSPTTSLTLGIELDSLAQELRLPPDKLTQLKREVHQWQHRRSCTKRELQSFLGLLNHAASVIGPGRTFMRSLVDLLKGVKYQHHHIHLRGQARDDLLWWAVSSIPNSGAPPIIFSSGASGAWGCSAAWGTQWLQLRWPPAWSDVNIAIKEMVPVILAAAVWGPAWTQDVGYSMLR